MAPKAYVQLSRRRQYLQTIDGAPNSAGPPAATGRSVRPFRSSPCPRNATRRPLRDHRRSSIAALSKHSGLTNTPFHCDLSADEKKVDGKEDEKIQGASPKIDPARGRTSPLGDRASFSQWAIEACAKQCRRADDRAVRFLMFRCDQYSPRRRRHPDPEDLRTPPSVLFVRCASRGLTIDAVHLPLFNATSSHRVKVLTPGSSRRSRPISSTSRSASTRRSASRRATQGSPLLTCGTSRPIRCAFLCAVGWCLQSCSRTRRGKS